MCLRELSGRGLVERRSRQCCMRIRRRVPAYAPRRSPKPWPPMPGAGHGAPDRHRQRLCPGVRRVLCLTESGWQRDKDGVCLRRIEQSDAPSLVQRASHGQSDSGSSGSEPGPRDTAQHVEAARPLRGDTHRAGRVQGHSLCDGANLGESQRRSSQVRLYRVPRGFLQLIPDLFCQGCRGSLGMRYVGDGWRSLHLR